MTRWRRFGDSVWNCILHWCNVEIEYPDFPKVTNSSLQTSALITYNNMIFFKAHTNLQDAKTCFFTWPDTGKFFTHLLLSPKEKETGESKVYRGINTAISLIFMGIKFCGFSKMTVIRVYVNSWPMLRKQFIIRYSTSKTDPLKNEIHDN